MPKSTKKTAKTAPKRSTTKKAASSKRGVPSAKKHTSAVKSSKSATPSAVKITNYASALKWLNEHTDYERQRLIRYNEATFNLDRMRKLLKALGNPEKQLKFVHIAGTKGKGSTVAMLSSMLTHCGYTIGSYTSPHLIDLRERIQVNHQLISHADLTEMFKRVKEVTPKMDKAQPTFFEVLTAAAIQHFADQAVDLVILETGLGGRLDSTNVITPLVSGITEISLDHTNVLGSDLIDIAKEKAGIMKKDVPVISVPQTPEVVQLLRDTAETIQSPLQVIGEDITFSWRFEANRQLGPHTRVCLNTESQNYDHLPVPLQGEHQAGNCGLALAILDKLKTQGFNTPEEKLIDGLATTTLQGRMEIIWDTPRILIDGAHNATSIKALIRSVGAHVPYDSQVIIFGCAQDKDVDGMLKEIALGADKVIFTRAKGNPRAMEPKDLLAKFNEISHKMAQIANNLDEALNLASRAVSREDIITITGSFFLCGEAKKHLIDLKSKRDKEAKA